jgi:hypothetical protein
MLKLICRLRKLVSFLEQQHTLIIHQNVDQFYYMQRIEEMLTVYQQYQDSGCMLHSALQRIEGMYIQTYLQWRRDVLWLHRCKTCNVK